MIRVLIELWPVTLPTGIYLLWYAFQTLRKRKRGEVHHPLREGPWRRIFLLTVAIAIVCAFTIGLLAESEHGTYVPAQLGNGHVIDGQIK
jgi:hypothetical protein